MRFDEDAVKALYVAMRLKGYRGGRDEMMDELRAQSYGAEVRLFCTYTLSVTLQHYPGARKHMAELCQQAQKRFAQVTTSAYNLGASADIVFSHGKRQRKKRGQPLRLDCVAITAYVQAGRAEVRLQAYTDNELRRDTSRYFTRTPNKGGTP